MQWALEWCTHARCSSCHLRQLGGLFCLGPVCLGPRSAAQKSLPHLTAPTCSLQGRSRAARAGCRRRPSAPRLQAPLGWGPCRAGTPCCARWAASCQVREAQPPNLLHHCRGCGSSDGWDANPLPASLSLVCSSNLCAAPVGHAALRCPASSAATLACRHPAGAGPPNPLLAQQLGMGVPQGLLAGAGEGPADAGGKGACGARLGTKGAPNSGSAAATLYQGSNQAEEPSLVIVSHLPTSTDQSTSGLTAASLPPPLLCWCRALPAARPRHWPGLCGCGGWPRRAGGHARGRQHV